MFWICVCLPQSFLQGSSVDLLPTPEVCDESPVSSTVTHKAFRIIDAIPADLPASVQSLRAEIGDLKKTIYSVKSSEESNCIDGGAVTLKFRLVIFAFILWALFAAVVVSVGSGEEVAYSGPLPTWRIQLNLPVKRLTQFPFRIMMITLAPTLNPDFKLHLCLWSSILS